MLAVSRTEIEAYLEQNGAFPCDRQHQFSAGRAAQPPAAVCHSATQGGESISLRERRSACAGFWKRMKRSFLRRPRVLAASQACGWRSVQHSCRVSAGRPHTRRQAASRRNPRPKLSARHIDAVDRFLFSACPSARASLPGGFSARREYDRLLLTTGSPASFRAGRSLARRICRSSTARAPCLLRMARKFFRNSKYTSTFAVKCDTIGSTTQILFRPRRAHDEMRVSGGRKTLKKSS